VEDTEEINLEHLTDLELVQMQKELRGSVEEDKEFLYAVLRELRKRHLTECSPLKNLKEGV